MDLHLKLRKIFAFVRDVEVKDYENCDRLNQLTGMKWKPEHIEIGYADTPSARYVAKTDHAVTFDVLQKRANRILFGNEDYKKPGHGFAFITRNEFQALTI